MTIGSRDLIVLDTSALVNIIRDNRTGQEIRRRFQLHLRRERPLASSVTFGEIGALARWWGWGRPRLTAMERLLDQLTIVSAGLPEIVNSYSEIKVKSLESGHPMSDNDAWIAATCAAVGAELITNDTDFDWLHPDTIIRHYVQQ